MFLNSLRLKLPLLEFDAPTKFHMHTVKPSISETTNALRSESSGTALSFHLRSQGIACQSSTTRVTRRYHFTTFKTCQKSSSSSWQVSTSKAINARPPNSLTAQDRSSENVRCQHLQRLSITLAEPLHHPLTTVTAPVLSIEAPLNLPQLLMRRMQTKSPTHMATIP
jgi:hypothetical protein